ncbi:MAG: tetratricopeptide repeat protein [Candidatus Promineifilaceae bacterium]
MVADKQYNVAKHYFDIDQYQKVIDTLANPAESLLERKRYWWMLGWSHYKLGNLEKARRYTERGLQDTPDFRGFHLTLYQIDRKQKNYPQAEERLNRILADAPDDDHMLLILSQYQMERKQYYDAARTLERVQMLNPENKSLPIMQSNLAFQQGDLTNALDFTERALQDDPDSKLAHQMHGSILLEGGQSERASKHLNTAINLGADSPAIIKAARQARSQTHWMQRPLRPIHQLGHLGVVAFWFLPMMFMLMLELNIAAGVIFVLGLLYHTYALFAGRFAK